MIPGTAKETAALAISKMIRLAFVREHGGTLSYTDEGYRLDPESETLFLLSRPLKDGAE